MSTWADLKNTVRLRKIYEERIKIIHLIRDFFWSENFVETDTPIALKYVGQEPYLNPVAIKIHDPMAVEYGFHLQTSPEFAMKKLLAAGWNKIFQICKCFRDYEDFGGQHNTEFTMIEWYRAPGSLGDIMDDTEKLFKYVGRNLGVEVIKFNGRKIDIGGKWERLSMKEIWGKWVGVNLDELLEFIGPSKSTKIGKLAISLGLAVDEADAFEDIFFKIFLNKIEPNLGNERPVFVYDYPVVMSSLSRRCIEDDRYAERFELYIGGLELANAFGELVDAKEQKMRLEEDKDKRNFLKKETWPVDPDFISALESGIPGNLTTAGLPAKAHRAEAGGIALGVDRMVLLFTKAKDINEVIFQSIKDQINI